MKLKKIHFIINPAAGKVEPILPVISAAFKDSKIEWDISITHKSGDASRLAKTFSEQADVIGVYGGDGTVMEVMSGLMESSTPLAILPGGTANVMAVELGIPGTLQEACELIARGPWELKSMDGGQMGNRHFMLRAGMGFEAEMVNHADRGIKNRWGRLAYFISAFTALKKMKLVHYHITVDHETHVVEGLDCIVANAGSVGYADLKLDQQISISDGLLDAIVLKKIDWSLARYVFRILSKRNPSQDRELVGHWQGKEIKVTSKPAQDLVCDGENLKKAVLHAKILPQAVTILVPKT